MDSGGATRGRLRSKIWRLYDWLPVLVDLHFIRQHPHELVLNLVAYKEFIPHHAGRDVVHP